MSSPKAVSDCISGGPYLATRDRLARLCHEILALAGDTGTDLSPIITAAGVEQELRKPFTFIACGEVNSGKSSLINTFCRTPLCPTGNLPATPRITRYRYAKSPRDTPIGPHLQDSYRPIGFLNDFIWIDTPGTNVMDAGQQALLLELAGEADWVLGVLAATNPWAAATWEMMSRLPVAVLDRSVLVLQQADRCGAGDVEVICGHVLDLARKRLGRELPVFPVSAKLAGLDGGGSEGGMRALEERMGRVVCGSAGRMALLDDWRRQAAAGLRQVEDGIDHLNRELERDERFVRGIGREIEEARAGFVARLPHHLENVASVFRAEALAVSRMLHWRLGAWVSMLRLFRGDRTGHLMEETFIGRLRRSVEEVAVKDGDEVVAACAEHWRELGGRIPDGLAAHMASASAMDGTLARARGRFIASLGQAAGEGIGSLRVRTRLDRQLRARNASLRAFMITTLLLVTLGGICGAFGLAWPAIGLCGLALVFLAGGIVVAWLTRSRVVTDFRENLLDACGTFANTLHGDYEDALRAVFHEYAATLGDLRAAIDGGKLAIEPHARRWRELFLTLKAIEQDM